MIKVMHAKKEQRERECKLHVLDLKEHGEERTGHDRTPPTKTTDQCINVVTFV